MKVRESCAAAIGIAVLLEGARGLACSIAPNGTLSPDGTHTGAAPGPVSDATVTVERGKGPKTNGCSKSASSCDGTGWIGLHFTPSADSDSPIGEVGYRMQVVAGSAPAGIDIATDPVIPDVAGNEATLYLNWDDGATDDQESIDFSLTLTPVDKNGNEGPTSGPIHVHDGGSTGGCTIDRRGGSDTRAVVIALALTISPFLRRRRKRP